MKARRVGTVLAGACLLVAFLAACSGHSGPQATGTLTGHLFLVGGPAPGTPRALTGKVIANGPRGRRATATDATGKFVLHLPAGRYSLIGRSPLYDGGRTVCKPATQITIQPAGQQTANVYCQAA